MQFRPTRAVINLKHLAHNVRELKKAASPHVFFCPMVKANAYGHGDVVVSKCLENEGIQNLGVALIEEGVALREKGIKAGLFFFGFCDVKGAQALVSHHITPVVSTWEQLQAIESVAPAGYPVHVKFDTGMRRLGFSLSEIPKLVSYFSTQSKLKASGIATHLHTGEDASNVEGHSFEQLRKFQEAEKAFQAFGSVSHTLNSAGLLSFTHHKDKKLPHGISFQQGARPGIALYGASTVTAPGIQLKPVMSLRSQAMRYHFIRQGEGVSYNHTWKAEKDSITAVVPIGYADGFHRLLSNRAEVLFRGRRVPLVGNVCMDYLIINVTSVLKNGETADSLRPETVTFFGEDENQHQLPAIDLAQKAQTISYEILTSVSERVPREVVP